MTLLLSTRETIPVDPQARNKLIGLAKPIRGAAPSDLTPVPQQVERHAESHATADGNAKLAA